MEFKVFLQYFWLGISEQMNTICQYYMTAVRAIWSSIHISEKHFVHVPGVTNESCSYGEGGHVMSCDLYCTIMWPLWHKGRLSFSLLWNWKYYVPTALTPCILYLYMSGFVTEWSRAQMFVDKSGYLTIYYRQQPSGFG